MKYVNLSELLKNPAVREEIQREVMKKEAERVADFFNLSRREPSVYVPSDDAYVPQGTQELFSPDGKLLMRDGELVEKPERRLKREIKYKKK